jgi:DNA invertase Pin-like site-specific DNA recombinase
MLVGILASFAAFEADLISARTKAALAVVKKSGSRSGKPIGNPTRPISPAITTVITDLRGEGMSYQAIAETLNDRAVPTAQGGKRWYAQSVSNVVRRSAIE